MLTLPIEFTKLMTAFAPVFSQRVFRHVQVLVVGAILAPGKRTVTSALRVMGLSHDTHFQNYHRVLNRDVWESRILSFILLQLLVRAFVRPSEPVVVGLDDHIERRRGQKIAAKGVYRDAVRSSKSFFVKTTGVRWVSLMLLVPIPWAKRTWALPVLTVLAPSERYHKARHMQHKKLTDWARQMIFQLRRWLPGRTLVVVADSSYAVLELLASCIKLSQPVTMITRLRLDAALYDPAPPRTPRTRGAPRKKGSRQPALAQRLADPATVWQELEVRWYGGVSRTIKLATGTAVWYHTGLPVVPIRWVLICDPEGSFEPQALLCTQLDCSPQQIVEWFVLRWQLEVTFQEARAHLGIETQRQWSELAIARTTPALLGLFSLVTLVAHELLKERELPVQQAAWYAKATPSFSDTLALVRRCLWPAANFYMSHQDSDMVQIPRALLVRLTNTLAYAA